MSQERDYVLGTHDDELSRLGLQHAVWRPHCTAAWRRAGFTAGHTLLDVGCGPGWASFDLAQIARERGKVVAVDRSRRFLDALEDGARARGLANIEAHERDLDSQGLPDVAADGAWARWVFAFVQQPQQLLRRVVDRLKPGGTLVIHEYVDYRTWRLSPRSAAFEEFVTEVMASWRATGGEPDIALDLARWLPGMDCTLVETNVITEVARPGDWWWEWPRAFVAIGLQRLVDLGRVSESRAAEMRAAFAEAERTDGAFLLTPAVLEIVARKK
ncbi:MAG: methyltransferase domain-containing protein [Candidatus Eisenbacteria bacterium]